jgi:hypothetical protein
MTYTYELQNGWTKQGLVDAITRHVPEDHRCMRKRHRTESPAISNGMTCAYYGDGDERCAVGACLPPREELPEDDYEAVWDNQNPDDFTPELMALLPLDYWGLQALQVVHDDCIEGNPRAKCLAWVEEYVEGEDEA